MGRPSSYTEEVAAEICARVAEGNSLRSVCQAEDMPAASTVFLWLSKHPAFSEQYRVAREALTETMAEDLLEIADDGRNDWVEANGGGVEYNGDHVQRSKLRVHARMWLMGKLAPKKYGDVQQHKHTGADDGPIRLEHSGRAAELLAELAAGKAGGHRGAAPVDQGRKTKPDPAAG